jgi:hypothetical protein
MFEETNDDYKIKEQKYSVHEKITTIKETKCWVVNQISAIWGTKFCSAEQIRTT